jgi:hypothetical protein
MMLFLRIQSYDLYCFQLFLPPWHKQKYEATGTSMTQESNMPHSPVRDQGLNNETVSMASTYVAYS